MQGLEVQPLVPNRQIVAFNQRQAEKACEIGMLEIGFVVRPRRQQHHAAGGIVAVSRAHGLQAIDECLVAGRQRLHIHLAKGLGKLPGNGEPVFKQIPQPRRRLRALRHDGPAPIGAVRQVKGGDVQVSAAYRRHAVHGAQVTRMTVNQRTG